MYGQNWVPMASLNLQMASISPKNHVHFYNLFRMRHEGTKCVCHAQWEIAWSRVDAYRHVHEPRLCGLWSLSFRAYLINCPKCSRQHMLALSTASKSEKTITKTCYHACGYNYTVCAKPHLFFLWLHWCLWLCSSMLHNCCLAIDVPLIYFVLWCSFLSNLNIQIHLWITWYHCHLCTFWYNF